MKFSETNKKQINKNFRIPKEIKSNQLLVGYYIQFLSLSDERKLLTNSDWLVLITIIEHSLLWNCKYCYLSYNDFINLSKPTIIKSINKLTSLNLIKIINTKFKDGKIGKNRYEIILPKQLEDVVKFNCKKVEFENNEINETKETEIPF